MNERRDSPGIDMKANRIPLCLTGGWEPGGETGVNEGGTWVHCDSSRVCGGHVSLLSLEMRVEGYRKRGMKTLCFMFERAMGMGLWWGGNLPSCDRTLQVEGGRNCVLSKGGGGASGRDSGGHECLPLASRWQSLLRIEKVVHRHISAYRDLLKWRRTHQDRFPPSARHGFVNPRGYLGMGGSEAPAKNPHSRGWVRWVF